MKSPEDLAKIAAETQRAEFVAEFIDYGHLLNAMTPAEFAQEIGKHFKSPYQACIITALMAKVMALEGKEWE